MGMYYFDVLKRFSEEKIEYCIVGGLAVNLHGVPRVTMDLDIVISMELDNIDRMSSLLGEIGYLPRIPVNPLDLADPFVRESWIREKNMKAFSFYHSEKNQRVVDIIIDYPLEFEEIMERARLLQVEDVNVPILSIDDLILLKRSSGREQDLSDAALLEEAKKIREEFHE